MIDLSIVIVNYNVKYFLAQCLNSILHSNLSGITTEILVIDNHSTDDSFPYLEDGYGNEVIFIKNKKNMGFGKACNQGIKKSQGDVILFLNPDTILSEETLSLSFNRLVNEESLGALGVRMVDGRGQFLPESKRSFPTPMNALLKLTGLDGSNLRMGTPYNLNHLDENKEHYIDVLCGAFFLVKRSVLNIVRGFDDDFFMYGEDIDLSLRIKKAGYKILYYPETSIIHFKGESHGDKDLKYYSRFYKAMSVYAEKHHSPWISILLKISIFVAGGIAIIKAYIKKWITLIIDGFLLLSLFYLLKHLWASFYYSDPDYYPSSIIWLILACVVCIILSLFIAGHYSKRASLRNTISGLIFGITFILILYGLVPAEYRFSRILMLGFSITSIISILISRILYSKWGWIDGNYLLVNKRKEALVVSDEKSFGLIKSLLINNNTQCEILGRIGSDASQFQYNTDLIGSLDQLDSLIGIYHPDEIIFNLDDFSADYLFNALKKHGDSLKIYGYSKNALGIVGSHLSTQPGEVYTTHFTYRINDFSSVLLKYIFDFISSVLLLLLSPILLTFRKNIVREAFKVLTGRNTWLGYNHNDPKIDQLPKIKEGIIALSPNVTDQESIHYANLNYAQNYSLFTDIEWLIRYIWEGK